MFWVLTCPLLPSSLSCFAAPSAGKSFLLSVLDAELGCSSGELKLGVDVKLGVSVTQVCFDGALAKEQVPGDVRR